MNIRSKEIRLDLNENLFLADEYYTRIQKDLDLDLSKYPDEYGYELCEKLANYYSLTAEHFLVANGSDAILDTAFKTLTPEKGLVGYFVPTYSYYDFFAHRNGLKIEQLPLNSDFTVPMHTSFLDDLDVLVLCSPNNPTGLKIDIRRIRSMLEYDIPVIIDEAYVEYSDESCIDLLDEFSNLILIRTFSKAWGLAGLRVGYAITSPQKAMNIRKDIIPFNLSAFSLEISKRALSYSDMVEEAVDRTIEEREKLKSQLEELGFSVLPSYTNFLFCRPPSGINPEELKESLLESKIRIKTFDEMGLKDYTRITVGPENIIEYLLEILEDIL